MNRMIDSKTESPQNRTKACFILSKRLLPARSVYDSTNFTPDYLVMDDKELCQTAFDRGSLGPSFPTSFTPSHRHQRPKPRCHQNGKRTSQEVSVACARPHSPRLRSLLLQTMTFWRDVTDGQRLLPPLASALTHRHTGVRYAACQCVRALSRSVAVTRTSLVDSGLGAALFAVFYKGRRGPARRSCRPRSSL